MYPHISPSDFGSFSKYFLMFIKTELSDLLVRPRETRNELSLGTMFDFLSLFNKCEYLYFIQQHSIPLDKKRINPDEVRKHFLKSCNCKQNKMDKKILCFDSDLKNLRWKVRSLHYLYIYTYVTVVFRKDVVNKKSRRMRNQRLNQP